MIEAVQIPEHALNAETQHGDDVSSDWRGRILSIYQPKLAQLPYFLFIPTKTRPDAKPLISMHGWTRNAGEHAFRLAKFAEKHGTVLIAPLFSKTAHRHYQRLEVRKGEACPAVQFDRLLHDVALKFQVDTDSVNLFGFSGGAQFAHRYALMRPGRINRMVLMAAGWYTFPDREKRYPFGIAASKVLGDRDLYLDKALNIPTCVVVGGRDVNRDSSLRTGPGIDKMQGFTRVERAERWIKAMRDTASTVNIKPEFAFKIIDRANHDFGECIQHHELGDIIFDWINRNTEGADI